MEGTTIKEDYVIMQAKQLDEEGKSDLALNILYENIRNKKRYNNTIQLMEKEMYLYTQIYTERLMLHRQDQMKELLVHFRNSLQNTTIERIAIFIEDYKKLLLAKLDKLLGGDAAKKSKIEKCNDLESIMSPEDMMEYSYKPSSAVYEEDIIVCMKLIWANYKVFIELMKMSAKLIDAFSTNVFDAFDLLVKYSRRKEIKKICDIVLSQQKSVEKVLKEENDVSIPFLLSFNSDTMLEQLINFRIKLVNKFQEHEFHCEAYKTFEELSGLIRRYEKYNKEISIIYIKYYMSLSKLVWRKELKMHHVIALSQAYKYTEKLTTADREKLSESESKQIDLIPSLLLMSLLAIPSTSNTPKRTSVDSILHSKVLKLLFLNELQTREALVFESQRKGITRSVPIEIKALFESIESFATFNLQQIMANLKKCNSSIFGQYYAHIEEQSLIKLLIKLSNYYKSISISKFKSMIEPIQINNCERLIGYLNKLGIISIKIDYKQQLLLFNPILKVEPMEWLSDKLAQISTQIGANKLPAIDNFEAILLGEIESTGKRKEILSKKTNEMREKTKQDESNKKKDESSEKVRQKVAKSMEMAQHKINELLSQQDDIEKQLKSKLMVRILSNYPNTTMNLRGKEYKLSAVKVEQVTLDELEKLKASLLDNESSGAITMANTIESQELIIETILREKKSLITQKISYTQAEIAKMTQDNEQLSKERTEFGKTLEKIKEHKTMIAKEIEESQKGTFAKVLIEYKDKKAKEIKESILKRVEVSLKEIEEKKKMEELRKKQEAEKKKDGFTVFNDKNEKGGKGEKNELFSDTNVGPITRAVFARETLDAPKENAPKQEVDTGFQRGVNIPKEEVKTIAPATTTTPSKDAEVKDKDRPTFGKPSFIKKPTETKATPSPIPKEKPKEEEKKQSPVKVEAEKRSYTKKKN